MAKREVLGGETGARSEEEPNKAHKQLDHPVRLGGILAMTINRKSLYNQQYGVFARDRSRVVRMRIGHAHHAVRRSIGFALVDVVHRADAQFGLEQAVGQQALHGAIADRLLHMKKTIDAAIGRPRLWGRAARPTRRSLFP